MNEASRPTLRLADGADGVAEAAAILKRGGLVAFPTETVYGLGALAEDAGAVARLYAAKERPRFNPLIAHLADREAAFAHGDFPEAAKRLAEAFWPGPLTLVVPSRGDGVCELARAGLGTVALRVPAHPIARQLLGAVARPVVAPSANRSGRVSPTEPAHVLADLEGRIDAVLDGGACEVGVESTIVACLDRPRLLRPGGLAREAIEALLGHPLLGPEAASGGPMAPGMLASHYAPRAVVRLGATAIRPDEAALTFGSARPEGIEGARATLSLSENGDLVEAAAHLFAHLRALDASGAATIAVTPIPAHGLGEAINDRLARAAAERSG